jgi:hypothetical protein
VDVFFRRGRRDIFAVLGIGLLLLVPLVLEIAPASSGPRVINEGEIIYNVPKDSIPAITNPLFSTAEEAQEEMNPEEQVLGIHLKGESRAYPVAILSAHEIVNDTVGGIPLAVTW